MMTSLLPSLCVSIPFNRCCISDFHRALLFLFVVSQSKNGAKNTLQSSYYYTAEIKNPGSPFELGADAVPQLYPYWYGDVPGISVTERITGGQGKGRTFYGTTHTTTRILIVI